MAAPSSVSRQWLIAVPPALLFLAFFVAVSMAVSGARNPHEAADGLVNWAWNVVPENIIGALVRNPRLADAIFGAHGDRWTPTSLLSPGDEGLTAGAQASLVQLSHGRIPADFISPGSAAPVAAPSASSNQLAARIAYVDHPWQYVTAKAVILLTAGYVLLLLATSWMPQLQLALRGDIEPERADPENEDLVAENKNVFPLARSAFSDDTTAIGDGSRHGLDECAHHQHDEQEIAADDRSVSRAIPTGNRMRTQSTSTTNANANSVLVQGVCAGSGDLVDFSYHGATGRPRGRCQVCGKLHWILDGGVMPNHPAAATTTRS